jgi:Flp pilus assembly protein CpaB
VVDVGEKAVTVAVPVEQAERVAFALAAGVITLALTGP